MLDPDTPPGELAALRAQGVCGVRYQIPLSAALPDLNGYRFRRFVTRLADAGMHLELNLGGEQLAQMLPALADHRVPVVVDHFGLLRSEGEMEGAGFTALLRSIALGRTYVKISAGFRLPDERLAAYAQRLLAEAGPERLFWGSDAPFVGAEERVSYTQTLEMLYRVIPDARARRAMSGAALRFYFF